MVFIFFQIMKNSSDIATIYHIFHIFSYGIYALLPLVYAVREGSSKKWVLEKSHGNTKFTDPTFDFFFRSGYYHFSF